MKTRRAIEDLQWQQTWQAWRKGDQEWWQPKKLRFSTKPPVGPKDGAIYVNVELKTLNIYLAGKWYVIGLGDAPSDGTEYVRQDGEWVPSTGGGEIEDVGYALILDDYTTADMTYICEAAAGSDSSAAVWRIKRMDESGDGIVIEWADGDDDFDNVADDRASKSYS